MDTPLTESAPPIPADVMADMQTVADAVAAGTPIPPDVVRRVRERSEKARRETLERFGVQDIGVAIIREMRDRE